MAINDVCELLGVTRPVVYGFMRAGELVPIRVGTRARFAPADVRDFLERRRERKEEP